jgi:hypothetical protein
MGKYDALREHLAASAQPVLRLSFAEIERILGDVLPPSARKHQAWWANEAPGGTHGHARSWLDAGYRTQNLDLNGQTVEFSAGAVNR